VIPPRFPAAGNFGYDDFFEGVAAVSMTQCSHIDARGNALDFSRYTVFVSSRFSEGLMIVGPGQGGVKCGYVDHAGKLAMPVWFDAAHEFSEGLAAAGKPETLGYIDRSGKHVIRPRFLWAGPFSSGVARVIEGGPCNFAGYGPCAFANPSVLGFPRYRAGWDQRYPRCTYTFINRRGERLINRHFQDALDFSEGLAAVGDGKQWGFIDKSGVVRIPLQFDDVGPFSEGLARFRRGRDWGYLDTSGRVVIEARFEVAEDFSEGAAVVGHRNGGMWFIDRSGKRLFNRGYRTAGGFRFGLAHVANGAEHAYIDRSGRTVFSYRGTVFH